VVLCAVFFDALESSLVVDRLILPKTVFIICGILLEWLISVIITAKIHQ